MKKNIIKKIKLFTKEKYRSFRSSIFLSLYGKIKVSKKPPNTKIITIKNNNTRNFSKYNYKFYEVQNGRVFTDNIENVSIISNNELLANFSYQQIRGKLVSSKKNQVVKTGTPRFIFKLNGTIAVLSQGASGYNNYAHCLFDIVPKIKLISLAFNLKMINYFYFSKLNDYQKEILKKLGINKQKIIDSNKYRHLQSNKIIGVTHPNYFRGTISEAHSALPKWIIEYLRNVFLKNKILKVPYEKIYIDRSDSKLKHCKIINNSEIKKFLKAKGFKVLKLSNFDFKKQINIFRNAKIIIGPHGAGFANLVFCKKNTKVVEIKPKNHPNKVYERICNINKLKYNLIKLRHVRTNKKGDMFLKKEILNKYLKN